MRFRFHRGGLAESMATAFEVSSEGELCARIAEETRRDDLVPGDLEVKPYGHDTRIEWDTYIVTLEGYGVVGFTDGPLPESVVPPFYLSDEQEHEYGYWRVIDRRLQDTPAYEGAALYGQEHVVCMCNHDQREDAEKLCGLLNTSAGWTA